jgi:hypothetical protein
MKKIKIVLLAPLMVTITMADFPAKVSKLNDGKVHGYVRVHHILDGEANAFDKNTGSTLGLALKYGETFGKYFAVGGEIYGVTALGFHNDEKTQAFGQGLGISTKDDMSGHLSGLHFTLKNLPNKSKVTWARSQFKSPMTTTQISHVPNMYEYLRADTGVLGGNLSLSWITDMAYGSRSAADWGLIGENTATAGMAHSPFSDKGSNTLERAKYYGIAQTTGSTSSSGIAVIGYKKNFENFKLNLWNFKANNILNNFYAETDYSMKLGKGKVLVLSGQYLKQNIDDDSLNASINQYGGDFYGVQAKLKLNRLVLKAAYNQKDNEGGFYNTWGANPGYTSSIFSRNEYREGVEAYKGTAVYNLAKNLALMVSYAHYGQSNMSLKTSNGGFAVAQTDAKETDMVLVYKPKKNIMLKLFNANRTSEFNGITAKPRMQNQTRFVANYAF